MRGVHRPQARHACGCNAPLRVVLRVSYSRIRDSGFGIQDSVFGIRDREFGVENEELQMRVYDEGCTMRQSELLSGMTPERGTRAAGSKFSETIQSDGASHMGGTVWVGLWVKGGRGW